MDSNRTKNYAFRSFKLHDLTSSCSCILGRDSKHLDGVSSSIYMPINQSGS